MGRVEGKVALVTGAARGMGRSHALRLAEEGADLILIDICADIAGVRYPMSDDHELERTAEDARAKGARVVSGVADVRNREGLRAVVDAGVAELGHLDTVVANAGILIEGRWDQITEEAMNTTLGVNLVGVWNTCSVSIPHLLDKGGSIICVSSSAGLKGQPLTLAYTASKFGVTGLARGLANELAEYSIRVNSVHPTGVPTGLRAQELHDMLHGDMAHLAPIYQNALPVQQIEAVDVSNAVLYLASDEARYVTGMPLKVDAGVDIR